jgi:hypothetical protein
MIRFRWLSGDVNWLDYGGKWVSNAFTESDYPAWFVIELNNVADCVGEREAKEVGAKYWCTLSVVMPGMVPADEMASARRSWGIADDEKLSDVQIVEVLHSYGIKAESLSLAGNNAYKLIRQCKAEAMSQAAFTFGFAMDRAQNRIGASGWDCLAGNPLGALRGATMKEVVADAVRRESEGGAV